MVGTTVAIVRKNTVTYLKVTKTDKRGKWTLEDGSEWNARTGYEWGSPYNRYSIGFKAQMVAQERGEQTEKYRAERQKEQDRLTRFKESTQKINQILSVYYANDLNEVREKLAEARTELEKLEKEFA